MADAAQSKRKPAKRQRNASVVPKKSTKAPTKRARAPGSKAEKIAPVAPNQGDKSEDYLSDETETSSFDGLPMTSEELQQLARDGIHEDDSIRQLLLLRSELKRSIHDTKADLLAVDSMADHKAVPMEEKPSSNVDMEKITVKFAYHGDTHKIFQLTLSPADPIALIIATLKSQEELKRRKFVLKFDNTVLLARRSLLDYEIEDDDQVDIELEEAAAPPPERP